MIKNWGAFGAFVALLAIVGFALWLDSGAPHHRNSSPDYSAEASKNKNEAADFMPTVVSFGRFLEEHNGAVSAAATIVIAVFTVLLAVRTGGLFKETAGLREAAESQREDMLQLIAATKHSADAAHRSADIAERSLTDAERPYLFVFGVKRFSYDPHRPEMQPTVFVEYNVANYGKTPAIVDDAKVDFVADDKELLLFVREYDTEHPLVVRPIIGPGESTGPLRCAFYNFEPIFGEDGPGAEVTYFDDRHDGIFAELKIPDGHTLNFEVTIGYHGPFTKGHETGAYWRYKGGTFVLSGGKKTTKDKTGLQTAKESRTRFLASYLEKS